MILTADYPPDNWSGIGIAVEHQARALAALGAEIHVLRRGRSSGRQDLRPNAPRVYSLDGHSFPIDPAGFDFIHLHSLSLSELALELRRRTRTRLAYTAHSQVDLELRENPAEALWWSRLQQQVMRASDLVVFPSQSEMKSALRSVPEIAARSRVIANGLPLMNKGRVSGTCMGPMVFAGRFAISKGIGLIEEVLPLVRQKWQGQFALAGGHGDEKSRRSIERLRSLLGDALLLPGWLTQAALRSLLANASLVLVPSVYEPFGMIALEAMQMGAPVLAARTGGMEETIGVGSGGRLLASRDPKAWCDAAVQIVGDRDLRESLRELGPTYVATHFNSVELAKQLLRKVYH